MSCALRGRCGLRPRWGKPHTPEYEREHAFELHKYRQADDALNRWEADGERIDYKGWQVAMKHLNKERFALDFELQAQKEEIRRLEVVKREFIRERNRLQTERHER